MKGYRYVLMGAALALLGWSATFQVPVAREALILENGTLRQHIPKPGTYFLLPFTRQVRLVDTRLHSLVPAAPVPVLTADGQEAGLRPVILWEVIDARRYYATVQANEATARERLLGAFTDAAKQEAAAHSLEAVVAGDAVQARLLPAVAAAAAPLGLAVRDVQLQYVEPLGATRTALLAQMRQQTAAALAARQAAAAQELATVRAQGQAERERIRLAGVQEAGRLRGAAEARAAAITAGVAGRQPEFYAYWKSLGTYRALLGDKGDTLILDARSPFLKYLSPAAP